MSETASNGFLRPGTVFGFSRDIYPKLFLNTLYSYISNAHGPERFTCMVPSNADPAPVKPIHGSITNPGNQGLGKGK